MERFVWALRLVLSGKFVYLYAGLRRRWLFVFYKEYVLRALDSRRGSCSGAGHCCKATIPWCRHLETGKCRAYASQPLFCRIFPIDERDQKLSGMRDICGYSFDHRGRDGE